MNIKSGRALCNGISFTSQNNVVTGYIDRYGEKNIKIKEKKASKKYLPSKIDHYLSKTPFIRGVYFLIDNKYIRIVFIFSILLSLINNSSWIHQNTKINQLLFLIETLVTIIIIAVIIKHIIYHKNVFSFHGAEHKVANTIWDNRALTLREVKKSSRISEHCGSNLVVFWIVCQLLLIPFNLPEVINILAGFSIAYELFKINNGHKKPIISIFYKLGGFMQEKILTREPSDEQLDLAILVAKAMQK